MFRFYFAMFMAKWAYLTLKLIRRPASYFPGKLAVTICPDFLGRIEKPDRVLAVTGTNGKTTTANMLIDGLKYLGYDVLNNQYGSNINAGIATALLIGCKMSGKQKPAKNDLEKTRGDKTKYAVLEVDERSSLKVYSYVTPTTLTITNIFRDSMKRNPHTEYICSLINQKLPKETTVILDSDDPRACTIGKDNKRVFYGIPERREGDKDKNDSIILDLVPCPKCGAKLEYDYVRYHHIGQVHCSKCDYRSPRPDYTISNDYRMLSEDNIFNMYNQLACVATLKENGITNDEIKDIFNNINIVASRYNEENVNGTEIVMQIAKGQNPVACSRNFEYIKHAEGNKAVVLNLDDKFDTKAKDENVAWIYDVDYEYLNDPSIKEIVVGGIRCVDNKVRLLLAGIPEEKIKTFRDIFDEPEGMDLEGIDKIFILYDVYTVKEANQIKEKIKARL